MIKIGLTGGIGSGKTEVARSLGELGAAIIDVDRLAHIGYLPGTAAYDDIVRQFGTGILGDSDVIDRQALGGVVFANPEKRRALENIIWPVMRQALENWIQQEADRGADALVIDAAVLFEAGWDDLVDQIWLVEAPEDTVLHRLRERTGLDEQGIRERIDAQMSDRERADKAGSAAATVVRIANDSDMEELEIRAGAAWRKLSAA